ncbi:MAG: VOC family protein [Propionibacteriaceae bacterium]|nr:VOC family protein [Propionibacteriaceae bacterium]
MPIISTTSVYVDDQDKALTFYTEKLGFVAKTDVTAGEYRWLTVVSDVFPDGVELVLEPDAHPAAKTFKAALVSDGIPFNSFVVADVDAIHSALTAQGVEFTQPPTDMGPVRVAVLDDTCGNLIQLTEFKAEDESDTSAPA